MPTPAILERDRIGLLVVDLQERFRDLIDGMPAVVAASSRLIRYCQRLDIPVRVTEQYPRGLGHTIPEVAALFEGGDAPAEKLRFSCHGATDFDRPQWIVCGIETHVCVYQTVRDLLAEGKQVAVAVDAVSSCNASDREIGLGYMRDLGAQLMSTQMIMFEILRDAGTPEFKSVADILKE
ncbi:MAG: isochorismatase family protein [Planctomycetota bacterium]|jgi:nicotinamidase-related amidase